MIFGVTRGCSATSVPSFGLTIGLMVTFGMTMFSSVRVNDFGMGEFLAVDSLLDETVVDVMLLLFNFNVFAPRCAVVDGELRATDDVLAFTTQLPVDVALIISFS